MKSNKCSKSYGSPRISSEFKDCSLPLTFDQYNHCSFGCRYCFSDQFRECNPMSQKTLGQIKSVNDNKLKKIFTGKYPNNEYYKNLLKNRFVFHWGGLGEPFCHYEKRYGIGLKIIEFLSDLKYPTLFSTKGLSLFLDNPDYMNVFEQSAKSKHFAFQFSIVANSDELSKKIEPNTPNTTERLKAMKKMSDFGYWTILRLRPFIIGITDKDLEELLIRAKASGANAISTEFFALDKRVVPLLANQCKVISDLVGFDMVKFLDELSPRERGGYMRTNRIVKEYFMERLYIKCRELGLQINISDPDFKELNDTGCCCGLPDIFKPNPEMTNWSKGQLTEALKDLRTRYWKSEGKDKYLSFDFIVKNASHNWFEESVYYFHDSIKRWSTDYSRITSSHKNEFKEAWNNLRSPDNPYNHYQGIIKPAYIDKQGLIVYEYSPKPYEYRWKEKGIL